MVPRFSALLCKENEAKGAFKQDGFVYHLHKVPESFINKLLINVGEKSGMPRKHLLSS
jgi:hypothetical protein